jgi:hypothetical protein
MKNLLIGTALLSLIVSCDSTKKEETAKTEKATTSLEKVSLENDFFSLEGKTVSQESYPTDETSRQILKTQSLVGVNKFQHSRQLVKKENQPVVRMNRDTYYSMAVIDVSKGGSITMPEIPKGKYMSVQPITEDHRIQAMMYGPGTFDLTTHIGTHIYIIVRLDATFSESEVAEIQNKMKIDAVSNQEFTTLPVNKKSFTEVENTLKNKISSITKRDGINALKGMFTDPRDDSNKDFDEEKYQVGAAIGWGGAQMTDNIYEISRNYSTDNCYQLTFEDPKDLAFWSITVYDKKGFMFDDLPNFSSNTAQINNDGTYTLSFGCGSDALNNLDIENPSKVFNIAVRHYQPSKKIIEEGYRLTPLIKEVSK